MDQTQRQEPLPEAVLSGFLEPDERLHVSTRARDAILAVTDRRLIVADENRLALEVAIDGIRRIQFDIERSRPATFTIVPEDPADEPQVLAIEPTEYAQAAQALTVVGRRLAGLA